MVFFKQLFSREQNLRNQVKHAANSNLVMVTCCCKIGLQVSHFALSYLLSLKKKKEEKISETAALLFFCEMYPKIWYMEFGLGFLSL